MKKKLSRDADGKFISPAELEEGYEPLLRAVSNSEGSLAVERLKQGLAGTAWSVSDLKVDQLRRLLAIRMGGQPTASLITALYRANEVARLAEWQRSRLAAKGKQPPISAEIIARLFTKPAQREHVIGCRQEEFGRNVEKYGRRLAVILYCSDIVRDFPLWVLLRRVVGAGILADLYRRFRGL